MLWSSFGQVQGCAKKGGGREGRGTFPRQPVDGTRAAQELSMGLQSSSTPSKAEVVRTSQPSRDWGGQAEVCACTIWEWQKGPLANFLSLAGWSCDLPFKSRHWSATQIQTLREKACTIIKCSRDYRLKHSCPWHLTIRSIFLHCSHSFNF